MMVVNPKDYWEKIFGATTFLNAAGQYVPGVLPINATFVQSPYMPIGFMCAGLPDDYFMGFAFQNGIEDSDHVRFIQDQRVYKATVAANGRPLSNEAFLLFDISNLKPSLVQVTATK